MTVVNYFELRWADGYGHVSPAPNDLVLALEELVAELPSPTSTEHATLAVRCVHDRDGERQVGLVRMDVTVPSSSRRLQFVHAIVLPAEVGSIEVAALREIVERRYGSDLEARIREVYVPAAVASKADGREALASLEVTIDDVIAVIGPLAAPSAKPPPPVGMPPSPPPPPGAAVRWGSAMVLGGLLVATLGVLLIAAVRCGRDRGDRGGDVKALQAKLDGLQARYDELSHTLGEAKSENEQLGKTAADLRRDLDRANALLNGSDCAATQRSYFDLKTEHATLMAAKVRVDRELAEAVDNQTRMTDELKTTKATVASQLSKLGQQTAIIDGLRGNLRVACSKVGPHRPDACKGSGAMP